MNFIKRRIIIYAVLLFFVANIMFILPRIAPSNAAVISTGALPAAVSAQIRMLHERLCLGQPIYVQYGCFLGNTFATWPPFFGFSYEYFPEDATNLVLGAVPLTLLLIIPTLLISIAVTLFLPRFGSKKGGSAFRSAVRYLGASSGLVPSFWIAIMMIFIFGVSLRWYPVIANFPGSTTGPPASQIMMHALIQFVLAFGALFISSFGYINEPFERRMRFLSRSGYTSASGKETISTGADFQRYIYRDSVLCILSKSGSTISSIITADILIEWIFNYGGLGNLFVNAMSNRDYPLLEASLFFLTIICIMLAFSFDLVRYRLDPGLRFGEYYWEQGEEETGRQNALHESRCEDQLIVDSNGSSSEPPKVTTDAAFELLDKSLNESLDDLPKGYTWEEVLAMLKKIGINADWEEIELAVKNYEAFRFGGAELDDSYAESILELARSLPRKMRK